MHAIELSIDKEIDFMLKYNLTADELFTLKLIFYAQEDHEEYIVNFFVRGNLTLELREILKSLQEKGIINQTYEVPSKGEIFKAKDVDLNKRVIDALYHHSEDLGMELIEAYPRFTNINGRMFSLVNIAKSFKSMEEFCWAYGKAIKFDLATHRHVMEILDWAKENNFIRSGICDFVISQQWKTYEAAMLDGNGIVFDAMESI